MFELIMANERNISVIGLYPSHELAVKAMRTSFLNESPFSERALDELIAEGSNDNGDFGWGENSAWSTGNDNLDWLIVDLSTLMDVVDATFVSHWNVGIEVSSPCKANTTTHEITSIGENDFPGDDSELGTLDFEEIIIDGIHYPACQKEAIDAHNSQGTQYFY